MTGLTDWVNGSVLSELSPSDAVEAVAAISGEWASHQKIAKSIQELGKSPHQTVAVFIFKGSILHHSNYYQPFYANSRMIEEGVLPSFKNSPSGLTLTVNSRPDSPKVVWSFLAPSVNRSLVDLVFVGVLFKLNVHLKWKGLLDFRSKSGVPYMMKNISPKAIVVIKRAELVVPLGTLEITVIPFSDNDRIGSSHVYNFKSVFAPKVDGMGLLITYASWILPFMHRKTQHDNWTVDVGDGMKITMMSDPDVFEMDTDEIQRLLPFQFVFLANDLPERGMELMHEYAVLRKMQEMPKEEGGMDVE